MLVVVGSWVWVALMSINLRAWKRANPSRPVPLPMFANVAGSYLWAWTAVGAALELLLQLIPAALGLTSTVNVGLARVFFSWTLHAIVYFWLIPTYIAYYTILPRAIGGRIYSDTMMRLAFITFLVVAMPIGIHHTCCKSRPTNQTLSRWPAPGAGQRIPGPPRPRRPRRRQRCCE